MKKRKAGSLFSIRNNDYNKIQDFLKAMLHNVETIDHINQPIHLSIVKSTKEIDEDVEHAKIFVEQLISVLRREKEGEVSQETVTKIKRLIEELWESEPKFSASLR